MLDRNRHIKPIPQKFQLEEDKQFDVILTCESRIFDESLKRKLPRLKNFIWITSDLEERQKSTQQPVHVINIDIKDNHESATIGGIHLSKLAAMLEHANDLDDEVDDIVEKFESETGEPLLHAVAYY